MLIDEIKKRAKKEIDKMEAEKRKKAGFDKLPFFGDSLEIEIRKSGDENGTSKRI